MLRVILNMNPENKSKQPSNQRSHQNQDNREQHLLQRCRDLIREIVPGAKVILYGSRARGDAEPDSDYDLLVLTQEPINWHLEDAIREKLYPLELETGAALSIATFSEKEWDSPLYQAMPFNQNVRREGVVL